MKRAISGILLSVVLSVSVLPSQATGQGVGIVGTALTGTVVDKIGDALNGAIDNARQSGDYLAMRAAQEALYILDAFKATNQDLLDKTFEAIGKERQAVLNNVNKTLEQIEAGRIDTLDRLQETGDQLDRLSRDVTFKDFPVVFRYRGTVITPGEKTDIRLLVEGHRLTGGTPHLILRGARYEAKVDGEALRFDLPRSLFVADEAMPKFEDASLVVENRTGGFLGWFQNVGEKTYDLSFVTLPKVVATVTVNYKAIVDVPQERAFEQEVNYNSSSRGWSCRPFAYSPASADRRFDLSRSSVTPTSGNSRGELRNPQVRDVGISFELCARRGTFDRDNGFRHALVRYVEVWKTTQPEPHSDSASLEWTSSASLKLPPRFSDLVVTVRDFNGVARTVAAAGGATGDFAVVRYDADSNLLIVDPRVPAAVNAL